MALVDVGLWCEIRPADFAGRAALFVDRDGVIVADKGYLRRREDVHVVAGAAAAVARCNALGIPIVVVTNQSGIARGYYGWDQFEAVQAEIAAALLRRGGRLDAVLACAYHADGGEPLCVPNHPWRKPNPGMLIAAANRMKLVLSRSWIVGDKVRDLAAGLAAGLSGGTLVSPDNCERRQASALTRPGFHVELGADLSDAVDGLIAQARLR